MTAPRFFLRAPLLGRGQGRPDAADIGDVVEVPLSSPDLHHAADVLRLKAGEELTVSEPSGAVWRLRAQEVSRERLLARILGPESGEGGPSLTLVQGVAKGPKMDRIVEQAVEIGVTEILPVLSERCVVRLDSAKRAERGERWRRVAEAAAKQSRRGFVPRVHDPLDLAAAVQQIAAHDAVIVVWEEADPAVGVARALAECGVGADDSVALVVGPEGGLDAREIAVLRELGGRPCSLGRTIMRTETACLVALVLALAARGGLGAER